MAGLLREVADQTRETAEMQRPRAGRKGRDREGAKADAKKTGDELARCRRSRYAETCALPARKAQVCEYADLWHRATENRKPEFRIQHQKANARSAHLGVSGIAV
jgi:hypothetical protein